MQSLTIPNSWLDRHIKVLVVGAGGTGSHIAAHLAVLHVSMLALGHPHGLQVILMDGDTVSEANCGRARFFRGDVGLSKGAVLAHRINMTHGLDFESVDSDLTREENLRNVDVVFGGVDTRASRRVIHDLMSETTSTEPKVWIDCGNGSQEGQVLLTARTRKGIVVPGLTSFYPEILDELQDPKDDGPSCGMAEALQKQSAFVNATAALHAVTMLANLTRTGKLDYSGVFFNLSEGTARPLQMDLKTWRMMGYVPREGDVGFEKEAEPLAA